eukprot:TRINITY_DN13601_c0_g1_i1.p1 TRINITY_DN13601_c0_g1~~TRINITY_DN13601_c0_g1_i1.p1  ORF type:complete len:261 (-),score=39.39 TRINITY_DN13601_c0_g1_i1:132-914(-)
MVFAAPGLTIIKVEPEPDDSGKKGRIDVLDFSDSGTQLPRATNAADQEHEMDNKYDVPFSVYKGQYHQKLLLWLLHKKVDPESDWTSNGRIWIALGSMDARIQRDGYRSGTYGYVSSPDVDAFKNLEADRDLNQYVRDVWRKLGTMPEQQLDIGEVKNRIEQVVTELSAGHPAQQHRVHDIKNAFLGLAIWHFRNPPWKAFTKEAMQHMTGDADAEPKICVDGTGSWLIDHHRIRGAKTARVPIEVGSFKLSNCDIGLSN